MRSREVHPRDVYANAPEQNAHARFLHNGVRTTKYTLLTFLPKNLWEQFQRAANVYFLIISFLTSLPTSAKNPIALIGTFIAVLTFTAIKEAYEDFQRYKNDKAINRRPAHCLRHGEMEEVEWQHVVVGDLVRVDKDNPIPADMFLISSTDAEYGKCYIDTRNLDGETNLKTRQALTKTKGVQTVGQLSSFKFKVHCEAPRPDIYSFSGTVTLGAEELPLSIDNVLLRGCILRNTKHVWGLVLYTGHESKVMLNTNEAPFKMSNVMRVMNRSLYLIFAFQAVLCLTNTVAALVWKNSVADDITYMGDVFDESQLGVGASDGAFLFESYLTFIVAYSHLIPISLYVAMEVVKLALKFLVDHDLEMYHEESDIPALARTSNLVEELGQVQFIFSDKTGTLTCNKMQFVGCSIAGSSFGMGGSRPLTAVGFVPTEKGTPTPSVHPRGRLAATASGRLVTGGTAAAVREFWQLLATCHTVVPEWERPLLPNGEEDMAATPTLRYQAASPDELALVMAARDAGYTFSARTPETVTVEGPDGQALHYGLLAVLPFDSDRKRMSVVLRCPDGKVRLYCKGADNIVLALLRPGQLTADRTETEEHLSAFSQEGLRTLVVAYRHLQPAQWEGWAARIQEASLVLDRQIREQRLAEVYEELEAGLDLLGATAIEDRLQDGVPDAIHSLRTAGIKVWVLTGDKQETAINIGYSCRLLSTDMEVHRLSKMGTGPVELLQGIKELTARIESESHGHGHRIKHHGIVVTGAVLVHALHGELRDAFLKLALLCEVCICCRVNPKQKADVVLLVKHNLPVITLAVGDGANDVSMIQAAHVGVGINGEEGTQAVRSSDYSIGQFRFLKKLLLVHGRWGYNRITLFILYYFYKNMTVALAEFFFAWYCGFSGQLFFANWLSLSYNAVFTSYPCIFALVYEQDLCKEVIMDYPKLYSTVGPAKKGFGRMVFVRWILTSLYHAAICFFIPVLSMDGANWEDGKEVGQWFVGTASFTCVILVVTFKMAVEVRMWTRLFVWITIISLLVYFITAIILSTRFIAGLPGLDWVLLGMIFQLFTAPRFYLVMVLVPVMALLPDFLWVFIHKNYFPSPSDLALRMQRGFLHTGEPAPKRLRVLTASERREREAIRKKESEGMEQPPMTAATPKGGGEP